MKIVKYTWFLSLLLAALTAWGSAYADSELDELIETALQDNPMVAAQRSQLMATRYRVPQAGSLDDPRIGVRASNIPLSNLGLNNTPMSGIDFSLAQKVPFPGKLKYRKKAEQAESEAVEQLLEELENRIRFEVSQAYYELYRIDKALYVTRQNRALLISLAKAAEARYATNQAKGPDVFRAQTFASELENSVIELRQERESAVVRLNTLLNQASETPRKLRYRFKIKQPPDQPEWDDVLEARPLLKALSDQVTAADHRVTLAKRQYFPDFDVSVSYRLREAAPGDPVNGSDFISGGVNMNIPLWAHWRQGPRVKENRARKMYAEQHYEAVMDDAVYDAKSTYQRLARQHRQIGIFSTRLLPQSRATYETSLAAYETSQIDFFSTIEALKDKHEIELSYYDIRSAYQITRARYEWVVGQASGETEVTP